MATHPARRPFPVALAFALALVTITAGACRDTDPNTPISQLSFPTERTGIVAMRYTLLNEDTVSASIEANFAVGNEPFQTATRVPGTEAITGLRASPGGTAHIFSWDALADLGPGTHVVFFQIVPSIGSQVGTVATIGPFSVFNVGIPERLTDLAEPLTGGAGSVSATGGAVLTGGADLAGTVVEITGDALALQTLASLTTPRRDHAQVTGQVAATGEVEPVVFGGRDANGPLASVERYDATADAWSALTDLPDARTGHTATLLGTGQHVLIAGGVDASGLLVTDLVYDLVTGTSIPTTGSSAGAARTGHAATSLPDGRVLVTGGEDAGSTPLDTTLIFRFDKTAGTAIYAQGPALTKPRSRHSAALLGDTLVVIGGETTSSVIDDGVETLDAILGAGAAFEVATVAATGADSAMSTPRAGHAIVALGETEALVLGGSDGTVALDSLERFVLSLGSFVTVPVGLAAERGQPIAVPFGAGHALIAGGGSASVEIFRPLGNGSAGGASPEVGPTAGRTAHAGSLLGDGRVLVTGGASGRFAGGASVPLASAAVFDQLLAGTARLAQAGSMITARERHAQATLSDGRAVVAGGLGDSATALNSLEAYDPDTDSFSALRAVLPTGRSGLSAATLEDGRVLLIGGDEGAGPIADVQILAADGSAISAGTPLSQARTGHATHVLADGTVLVIGGDAGGTIERFDATGNAWTTLTGTLASARTGLATAVLSSGTEVLVAGGFDAAGQPVGEVAVIDLDANTVTARSTALLEARGAAVAVALSDGSAAILGGVTAIDTSVTASIETYSPDGDGTAAVGDDPDLPAAVSSQRAFTLTDGSALLIGGRDTSGAAHAGAETINR